MGPPKKNRVDLERRLFDLSIGPLRLLDTVLDKAGEHGSGALLRELLLEWRAYPSKSRFSARELRKFASILRTIEGVLRSVNEIQGARLVSEIEQELLR